MSEQSQPEPEPDNPPENMPASDESPKKEKEHTYNPELEAEHPWGRGVPNPRKPSLGKRHRKRVIRRADLTKPEYNVKPREERDREIWARRKQIYEWIQSGVWTQEAIAEKLGLSQTVISKDILIYKNYLRTHTEQGNVSTLTSINVPRPLVEIKVSDNISDFTKELGYQDKWFHHEWYELANTQKRFLLLAPRRHAKSTCLSVNYVLWHIARNPNIRILLVSNTDRQAKGFVRVVKQNIERYFPQIIPDNREKWAETEFIVRRDKILRDSTLSAVGVNGPIISRRIDLAILDDVVDAENATSEELREKVYEWLSQTLMPAIEPQTGQLIIIGTPFGPDDLYARLIRDKWPYKKYDAIIDQDKKQSLWPEVLPYECPERQPHRGLCCLMELKRIMGSIRFNAQYRCDASGYAGNKLKIEWLDYYRTLPENLEIVMGVDPAISQKTGADYFATSVVGYSNTENRIYLIAFYRGHYPYPEQVAEITRVWQQHKAVRIIVEATAYQEALYQTLQGTGLPVIPYKTIKDKVTRVLNISPYFENKMIRVREDMDDFIEEYCQFDKGAHDDLLDSLTLAVQDIIDRHSAKPVDYHPQIALAPVFKSRIPHFSSEPLFNQPIPKPSNKVLGEEGKGKEKVLNFSTGKWEWK